MENVEHRSVIKFLYLKKHTPTEIHQEMVQVYAENVPNLKKSIKWRRFEDISDSSAVEEWFEDQSDTVYSQGLLKVNDRCEKCVTCHGDYEEK